MPRRPRARTGRSSRRSPRARTCSPLPRLGRSRTGTGCSRETRRRSGTTCSCRSSSPEPPAPTVWKGGRPLRAARPGGALAPGPLHRGDGGDGEPGPPGRDLPGGVPPDVAVRQLHRCPVAEPGVPAPLAPQRGDRHSGIAPALVSHRVLDRLLWRAGQVRVPVPAPAAGLRLVRHPNRVVELHPLRRGHRIRPAEEHRPPPAGLPGVGNDLLGARRHHIHPAALHDPPAVRVAGTDGQGPRRGCYGPLLEQGPGIPEGGVPALAARGLRGDTAHLHPGLRRLRKRRSPRWPGHLDDRERDPKRVPGGPRLPGGVCLGLHPHGGHGGRRDRLRPPPRDRGNHHVSEVAVEPRVAVVQPAPARRPRKRWTRFILPSYTGAFMLYLSFPIFIIILFSFNQTRTGFGTAPRVKTTWIGFTLDWYKRVFEIPDLTAALQHSLLIAITSSRPLPVPG